MLHGVHQRCGVDISQHIPELVYFPSNPNFAYNKQDGPDALPLVVCGKKHGKSHDDVEDAEDEIAADLSCVQATSAPVA